MEGWREEKGSRKTDRRKRERRARGSREVERKGGREEGRRRKIMGRADGQRDPKTNARMQESRQTDAGECEGKGVRGRVTEREGGRERVSE
jgi:hypothetical protein